MEICNRTQSTERLWLFLPAAAVGTFLLAFVPSGAWLGGAAAPGAALSAMFLKQFLTVQLLCVVPSLWARIAHRISPTVLLGLAAFAFGCGWLINGNAADALYTTLLCALPGTGLWGLQKLKLSNFRAVIYGSFLILAALFGFVCLRDLIRTGDAYTSYKNMVDLYGQMLNGYLSSGELLYGSELAQEGNALVDMFRSNPESYCVTGLLIVAMAASLSGTLFSHLWNRNGEADLVPLPRFAQWRCERWYVYLTAGFMLATMLLSMAHVQAAESLSGVAGALWRMPCMLGGLCTVRRIGNRTGKGWIFWVTAAMLIVLPSATGMVLSVLGLLSAVMGPKNVGEDGKGE